MLADQDGYIAVPQEATSLDGGGFLGRIVFAGVKNGMQRISTDLMYRITPHTSAEGSESAPTPAAWEQFIAAVKAKMGGTATEPAKPAAPADTSTAANYTAQVNAPSGLNVRKGPGTNYPVIGQIKDKKRYTIVEEKTGTGSAKGWGRLKAGGWVAIDWVKKA